ncbi:YbjQ family protein [Sporomusa sp.]|uniref:YbjQ family protein n=1 Tax=Sporomusa sp. TaxID=2078658 RepID=UPI002C6A31C8|nr:YbjQ family protein [Sporomusa sp.]HWR08006.1 YbjQ family protein [Sporomusa sp.]
MIVATAPVLEGYEVSEYLGVVTGEVVMGTNVIKDFFAGLSDIFGGRSNSYENSLSKGVNNVVTELKERAGAMGADAVIGVQHSMSSVGEGLMMIVIMGTAVKLQKKQ